jgi:cellulose biosynthesis protein BcsQ
VLASDWSPVLAYTPVSEAGGVGKTTTAATLAVSHARNGLDVLAIDMDAQNGSLSFLLGANHNRSDPDADHLVRHLIDRPKGDFEDLVVKLDAGVDLVASHNRLEDLGEALFNEKQQAERIGDSFSMYHQLRRVLQEAGVRDDYDVVIVDSAAKAGPTLYNALVATQHVVIPFEATAKGQESIDGLDDLVEGLEANLDVGVGVLAVVPIGVKGTRDQEEILDALRETWDVPVVIGERSALMEGSWRQQCSPYQFVENHRSRERDYEAETLEQFDALARHLEQQAHLTAQEAV